MPRNSADILWDYFKRNLKDKRKLARCHCCGKQLSFKTSVTNLKTHLKAQHRRAYDDYMEKRRALDAAEALGGDEPDADVMGIDDKCHVDSNDEDSKDGAASPVEDVISHSVFKFFSKESQGRARCDLCAASVPLRVANLTEHMKEKHSKVMDIESDAEETQENIYQEVVYLYDSDSKQESKPKKQAQQIPDRERPRLLQARKRRYTSPPREREEITVVDNEELNNFAKYITCLMKTVPKDVCTQLQLDIINLIMSAKLKHNVDKVSGTQTQPVTVESVHQTDRFNQTLILTMANSNGGEHGDSNMQIIDNSGC